MIKDLLDIDVDADFFCMGNLKQEFSIHLANMPNEDKYIGTSLEKNKYNYFKKLRYNLFVLYLLQEFIATFDDLIMLPLAIYNNADISDQDITVSISVKNNSAEIIIPNEELANINLRSYDLLGSVYDEKFLDLLKMPESSEINYEINHFFEGYDVYGETQKTIQEYMTGKSASTAEDYAREIKKYIAMPSEGYLNEYIFEVSSLRANEKKWLGRMLLLKTKGDIVSLKYSIKSKNTNGKIEGLLTMSGDKNQEGD